MQRLKSKKMRLLGIQIVCRIRMIPFCVFFFFFFFFALKLRFKYIHLLSCHLHDAYALLPRLEVIAAVGIIPFFSFSRLSQVMKADTLLRKHHLYTLGIKFMRQIKSDHRDYNHPLFHLL